MREFDQFTDGEVMRAKFQRLFPNCAHGPLQVTNCEVLQARIQPLMKKESKRSSCLSALYRLELLDSFNGQKSEQMLYAKAFLDNRSHAEFVKNMNVRLYPTGFNVAMAHLPELDTVVWCFPNDPVLVHLADVSHSEQAGPHLPYQFLPPGFQRQADLGETKVTVVEYTPENRCLIRYDLSSVKTDEAITVFGKLFSDDRGGEVYKWTEEMWKLSEENPKFFKIPRPLSYNRELHMSWQKGLQGTPLVECFQNWSRRNLLQTVAKGLARLHALALPIDLRITVEHHLEETAKRIAKLSKDFPRFRPLLKSIEHGIGTCAPALSPVPESVIHGDFRFEKLLLCGDRIALFDFDDLAKGDPLQDLAQFAADLHSLPSGAEMIEAMQSTLVEAYMLETGADLPQARLHWHLAVQFLNRACRNSWREKPSQEEPVQRYLELAKNELMILGCRTIEH